MRPCLALLCLWLLAISASAADPADVAKIHGGIVDCVGCNLAGADLTKVKGLTQKQLNVACSDAATKLPPGLKVHTCQ